MGLPLAGRRGYHSQTRKVTFLVWSKEIALREMELPGSAYLHALATISLTFVGFSALLLVFRQAMGRTMTRYESYFMLTFILSGFIVTAGSLLPLLLALYGLLQPTVWRVSSIIMAIPIFVFVVTLPGRRRAASQQEIPMYIWILLLLQLLTVPYLLMNAIGKPVGPGVAPYAAAMSGILFTSAIGYLLALAGWLREPPT